MLGPYPIIASRQRGRHARRELPLLLFRDRLGRYGLLFALRGLCGSSPHLSGCDELHEHEILQSLKAQFRRTGADVRQGTVAQGVDPLLGRAAVGAEVPYLIPFYMLKEYGHI